jgi:peptidoglycan/LPS O-acetylase OafA/YrhL
MTEVFQSGPTTLDGTSLDPTARQGGRIRSLDGLRGLAALTVLIDHSLITNPNFAQYLNPPGRPAPGAIAWWVAFSPLHIFWPGTEAVYLFFVLSGLVLALPWTKAHRRSWLGYYPARLARLYIPVVGAVALAAANVYFVHRHVVVGGSYWLTVHDVSLTWTRVLHDAFLLHGTDNLNGPLWSLEWEVVFSLALPLYIIGGRYWRSGWPLKLVLLMAAVVVGYHYSNPSLEYMPMFGFGVLMAFHWEELTALAAGLDRQRAERFFSVAAVVAVVFILSYWLLFAIGPLHGFGLIDPDITHMLAGLGGAIVIFLGANWGGFRHFLELPAVQWAGKRSFSIYLVHEPLLVSIAFLLGGHPNTAVELGITLPVALVVADIFFRLVEHPAIELSHVLGKIGEKPPAPRVRVRTVETSPSTEELLAAPVGSQHTDH